MFLITTKGIPSLKEPSKWSHDLIDFLGLCLQPQPDLRPEAATLLQHSFITKSCTPDILVPLIQAAKEAPV